MARRRLFLFCFSSGCLWGLIALALGYSAFGRLIWGGILVAPFIGLLVGWFSQRFRFSSKVIATAWSLASLYIAAIVFGVAVGLFDLLTGDSENRIARAVVIQSVHATLWGITFTGYAVILWPLAYLNHVMLWKRVSGN